MEQLTAFAGAHGLARLSIDQGLGAETLYEPEPATVTLSGMPVSFPVAGFQQATEDGEAALIDAVREATGDAARTADLFAGLGTFALAIRATFAAEASRDSAAALKRAAPAMTVEHRDLYRRPLDSAELSTFDAVVLDPPRAGAAEQVAASQLLRRSGCLPQLQPGDLCEGRPDAGRWWLYARVGEAGGPVPLVDPRRACCLLQWMSPVAVKDAEAGVHRKA